MVQFLTKYLIDRKVLRDCSAKDYRTILLTTVLADVPW